jgi:hypothetical protein
MHTIAVEETAESHPSRGEGRQALDLQGGIVASRKSISIPTQVRRLLPVAIMAAAATLGGCVPRGSTIAEPGPVDLCINAIKDGGGEGNPGDSGWDITNKNIVITSGGNNVITQTNDGDSSGGNNVITQTNGGDGSHVMCCVNGKCWSSQ